MAKSYSYIMYSWSMQANGISSDQSVIVISVRISTAVLLYVYEHMFVNGDFDCFRNKTKTWEVYFPGFVGAF